MATRRGEGSKDSGAAKGAEAGKGEKVKKPGEVKRPENGLVLWREAQDKLKSDIAGAEEAIAAKEKESDIDVDAVESVREKLRLLRQEFERVSNTSVRSKVNAQKKIADIAARAFVLFEAAGRIEKKQPVEDTGSGDNKEADAAGASPDAAAGAAGLDTTTPDTVESAEEREAKEKLRKVADDCRIFSEDLETLKAAYGTLPGVGKFAAAFAQAKDIGVELQAAFDAKKFDEFESVFTRFISHLDNAYKKRVMFEKREMEKNVKERFNAVKMLVGAKLPNIGMNLPLSNRYRMLGITSTHIRDLAIANSDNFQEFKKACADFAALLQEFLDEPAIKELFEKPATSTDADRPDGPTDRSQSVATDTDASRRSDPSSSADRGSGPKSGQELWEKYGREWEKANKEWVLVKNVIDHLLDKPWSDGVNENVEIITDSLLDSQNPQRPQDFRNAMDRFQPALDRLLAIAGEKVKAEVASQRAGNRSVWEIWEEAGFKGDVANIKDRLGALKGLLGQVPMIERVDKGLNEKIEAIEKAIEEASDKSGMDRADNLLREFLRRGLKDFPEVVIEYRKALGLEVGDAKKVAGKKTEASAKSGEATAFGEKKQDALDELWDKRAALMDILEDIDNHYLETHRNETKEMQDIFKAAEEAADKVAFDDQIEKFNRCFNQFLAGTSDEIQAEFNRATQPSPSDTGKQRPVGWTESEVRESELNLADIRKRVNVLKDLIGKQIPLKDRMDRELKEVIEAIEDTINQASENSDTYVAFLDNIQEADNSLKEFLQEDLKDFPQVKEEYRKMVGMRAGDRAPVSSRRREIEWTESEVKESAENLTDIRNRADALEKAIELVPEKERVEKGLYKAIEKMNELIDDAAQNSDTYDSFLVNIAKADHLLEKLLKEDLKDLPQVKEAYRKAVGLESGDAKKATGKKDKAADKSDVPTELTALLEDELIKAGIDKAKVKEILYLKQVARELSDQLMEMGGDDAFLLAQLDITSRVEYKTLPAVVEYLKTGREERARNLMKEIVRLLDGVAKFIDRKGKTEGSADQTKQQITARKKQIDDHELELLRIVLPVFTDARLADEYKSVRLALRAAKDNVEVDEDRYKELMAVYERQLQALKEKMGIATPPVAEAAVAPQPEAIVSNPETVNPAERKFRLSIYKQDYQLLKSILEAKKDPGLMQDLGGDMLAVEQSFEAARQNLNRDTLNQAYEKMRHLVDDVVLNLKDKSIYQQFREDLKRIYNEPELKNEAPELTYRLGIYEQDLEILVSILEEKKDPALTGTFNPLIVGVREAITRARKKLDKNSLNQVYELMRQLVDKVFDHDDKTIYQAFRARLDRVYKVADLDAAPQLRPVAAPDVQAQPVRGMPQPMPMMEVRTAKVGLLDRIKLRLGLGKDKAVVAPAAVRARPAKAAKNNPGDVARRADLFKTAAKVALVAGLGGGIGAAAYKAGSKGKEIFEDPAGFLEPLAPPAAKAPTPDAPKTTPEPVKAKEISAQSVLQENGINMTPEEFTDKFNIITLATPDLFSAVLKSNKLALNSEGLTMFAGENAAISVNYLGPINESIKNAKGKLTENNRWIDAIQLFKATPAERLNMLMANANAKAEFRFFLRSIDRSTDQSVWEREHGVRIWDPKNQIELAIYKGDGTRFTMDSGQSVLTITSPDGSTQTFDINKPEERENMLAWARTQVKSS